MPTNFVIPTKTPTNLIHCIYEVHSSARGTGITISTGEAVYQRYWHGDCTIPFADRGTGLWSHHAYAKEDAKGGAIRP